MANPFNLSTEEIDKLEASGHLAPETAAEMRGASAPMVQPMPTPSGSPKAPQIVQAGQPMPSEAPGIGSMLSDAASTAKNWLMAPGGTTPPDAARPTNNVELNQPAMAPTSAPTEFQPAPQRGPVGPNPLDKHAKGIERGYNMQEKAERDAAEAGKNLADETAHVLQQHQVNAEKIEADRVTREQERQTRFEKEVGDYDKLSQEMLNTKVDPRRWFNNQSTGQKIMAGIGIFLGGVGGGLTKSGKNPALDIINNAINADIDAQKSELAKLKDVGGMKQNVLSMMRDKFGDERQAEAATKAFHLDQTIMKLKEVAAQNKAPELQAQADKAIGQLEVQKHGLVAQFEAASKSKSVMLGGGQQLPQGVDVEQLSPEQRERYVTGVGLATTKEGAKQLMALKASTDSSSEMLGELIGMTNKTGKSINTETRTRASALSDMLKGQIREGVLGPGTVNDSERKILDRLVADPTAIFSLDANSRVALQTVMDRLQANFNNTAKANGLRPVNQQVRSFQKR